MYENVCANKYLISNRTSFSLKTLVCRIKPLLYSFVTTINLGKKLPFSIQINQSKYLFKLVERDFW